MAAVSDGPENLREGVRALRVPRGLLFHDPRRWRLFQAPAHLPAEKLRAFLEEHGLQRDAPAPAVASRLRQLFWVALDQVPSLALRVRPSARFSCVACGTSCRTLKLGPLQPADAQRLLRLDWSGTAHDPSTFFVDEHDAPLPADEAVSELFLRRSGGRCQFLRDDNLCEVHARFGAAQKPLMCRMFPLHYRATPRGICVGMRLAECSSAPAAGLGLPVVEQHDELLQLLAQHDAVALLPPSIWLDGEKLLSWEEYERLEDELLATPPRPRPGRVPAFAQALFAALDGGRTEPAHEEDLAELSRRAGLHREGPAPDDAALLLEDRFCRETLFNKDLFLPPQLVLGAALLVIKAHLARRDAAQGTPPALNAAWKAAADRELRALCRGLDLRRLAARLCLSPSA